MSQGRKSRGAGARIERPGLARQTSDAARKRAAIEIVTRHEAVLKRTARRYSLDAEDADDAFQRALEIVLTKAPTTDLRELIRWTQTVTKHEALAVRHNRERLLGPPATQTPGGALDPVALIPAEGDGPDEQAERREAIARSREALRALKPAELRALTLLAEGYSYAEIGEMTGFSRTKINRVLSEGRNRFRSLLSSSEDGSRCRELHPLLSAVCDGEASAAEAAKVREHLRACARCRSTMRAYRAAPRIAAALAPALPVSHSLSLLERAQEILGALGSRIPRIGGGADPAVQVAAAGGAHGAGMTTLAKLLTLCAGAAGGTAACMATGVLPSPLDGSPDRTRKPAIERYVPRPVDAVVDEGVQYQPPQQPAAQPEPDKKKPPRGEGATTEPSTPVAEAVEYEPAPAPPAPAPASGGSSSSGSAAGEFGP